MVVQRNKARPKNPRVPCKAGTARDSYGTACQGARCRRGRRSRCRGSGGIPCDQTNRLRFFRSERRHSESFRPEFNKASNARLTFSAVRGRPASAKRWSINFATSPATASLATSGLSSAPAPATSDVGSTASRQETQTLGIRFDSLSMGLMSVKEMKPFPRQYSHSERPWMASTILRVSTSCSRDWINFLVLGCSGPRVRSRTSSARR